MEIGFAIVSDAKNIDLREMTEFCIESIKRTVDNPKIVVSEKQDVNYDAIVIKQLDEFNYNRELNRCIERLDTDILILCNNDIVFTTGWLEGILGAFEKGYGSASPLCRILHKNRLFQERYIEGYVVRYHVAGWCLCLTKETYQKINKLDERVEFWLSDNLYASQLQRAGIRHCLCTTSVVNHIESVTLQTLNQQEIINYTTGQLCKMS